MYDMKNSYEQYTSDTHGSEWFLWMNKIIVLGILVDQNRKTLLSQFVLCSMLRCFRLACCCVRGASNQRNLLIIVIYIREKFFVVCDVCRS